MPFNKLASCGLLVFVLIAGVVFAAPAPAPCKSGCKEVTCLIYTSGGNYFCRAYDQSHCETGYTPLSAVMDANTLKCKDAGTGTNVTAWNCPPTSCTNTCSGNPPPYPEEGTCPDDVVNTCNLTTFSEKQRSCQ